MRQHIGADHDAAFDFAAETFGAGLFIHVGQIAVFRRAVAVAHAIEARQVAGGFRRRQHIVGGDRQLRIGQADFHGLRAQCAQLRDGRFHGLGRIANQTGAEEFARQANLQACQRLVQAARVVFLRTLQTGRIARIEAGHDVEQQAAILGGLRHRASLIETGSEGDHAVARNHAVGRLQTGDAAQRRRLTNRSAGIGAGSGRRQTRRNTCRAATGGAARHALGIPGIAHRPVETGFIGRAHRKLVHIGLAKAGHAGRLELLDDVGVVGRNEVGQYLRAAGGQPAFGAEDVLVRNRHTGQHTTPAFRAHCIGGARLGQGLVGIDADEGIEAWVVRLDAGQVVLAQFDAGGFARCEGGGEGFECVSHCPGGMGHAGWSSPRRIPH